MKKTLAILSTLLFLLLFSAGCNTVTHYDANGKITKVEKVTNASRLFDGTNQKSQMILIEGTYVKSDVSATAGESCTPGWVITFANGKTALINAKDSSKFTGAAEVVGNFFQSIEVSAKGVKTVTGNSAGTEK